MSVLLTFAEEFSEKSNFMREFNAFLSFTVKSRVDQRKEIKVNEDAN